MAKTHIQTTTELAEEQGRELANALTANWVEQSTDASAAFCMMGIFVVQLGDGILEAMERKWGKPK